MKRIWLLALFVFPLLLGLVVCTGCPLTAAAPAAAPVDFAAQRANVPQGLWIWIDLHQKSLTLYQGVQVKQRYVIATGTGQTPSPIGVYRITHRFSGDLGGFGTRFLGLNVPWGQFGIHGTNRPESIGRNASHGCIRMHVKDSEALYAQVGVGTKVVQPGCGGTSQAVDSGLQLRLAGRHLRPRYPGGGAKGPQSSGPGGSGLCGRPFLPGHRPDLV